MAEVTNSSFSGRGVEGPEDGEVVGLRPRAGEEDLAPVDAQGAGDVLAGLVHELLDPPADGVEGGGIAEMLPEEPGHLFGDGRVDGRRGVVVEIDHGSYSSRTREKKRDALSGSGSGEDGPSYELGLSAQLFLEDADDLEAGPLLAFRGRGAEVGDGDDVRMVDEREVLGRLLVEDVQGRGPDLAGVEGRRAGPSRRRRRRGRR